MNQVSYWVTPFARHEVPQAIINLAIQAEHKATGRWMWLNAMPQASYPDMRETVWFKVIAEWGAWREAEDKRDYDGKRRQQTA